MKPEQQTLVSWWIDKPKEGFTAYVEQTEQARMATSRIGQWLGRPFTADEVRTRAPKGSGE